MGLSKYKDFDALNKGKTKWEYRQYLEDWQGNFRYSQMNRYVKNDYDLDLLTDKGVYPYDYISDESRFKETQLPPKEAFYSKLAEEGISDTDYERAKIMVELQSESYGRVSRRVPTN